ncbi:MAG: PEP-utilizing enzyme, partial [Deltaproteobacteria bacterium]
LQCRPLQLWLSAGRRERALSKGREPLETVASGETTASPGVGSGPVFVVRNDFDKLRFPEGAVLVTSHAAPAWAPLLSRAAAVVAEVGSMAGHLANVAREFRVPALFGVAGATSVLINGDPVTVDADGMSIYRGRVESLLDMNHDRQNLMEGSPVHLALERVAAYVIPLNLIDPDSPEFHPKKCQTYHDITRFAHEISVREMFNFGKDHQFAERGSKRLVCEVPMQWWVINLDDGFKEPVEGELVSLENISSVPMLALWRGVTAIPWAGPPGVDAGGFLSVLMQSASNPALDPAVSSPFTARNYFMISKNFCNLMSRFGFHFSIVEALVSERSQENYVGFTFKGGAADLGRRVKRAQLLASILREYDFRVNVKEDSVVSRIDGRDEEFMKSRLVILGHLIMHTRQLDMIMASDSAVQSYRASFIENIESLLRVH